MHFAIRATPIKSINGKSHKTALKSSQNYSIKSKSHHQLFKALGAYTHTHTHARAYTSADQSDFKKPGAHAPGLKIILWNKNWIGYYHLPHPQLAAFDIGDQYMLLPLFSFAF